MDKNKIDDPLFETIQKMSIGERYAFRRNISNQKVPVYIQLYDALLEQETYNETKLKVRLAKVLPENKFAYTKHVLLQKLLESNAIFYIEKDKEMQVMQLLQIVRMLRVKGQISLAIKNLDKAFKIVHENQLNSLLRLCLNEAIRIELFNNTLSSLESMSQIVKESEASAHRYKELLQIQSVYLRLLALRRTSSVLLQDAHKEESKSIKQSFKEVHLFKDASSSFNNLYNMAKATIAYLDGDYENAFIDLGKNIELWQNGALRIDGNIEFYFDTFSMYIEVALLLQNFKAAEDALNHPCNAALDGDYAKSNFQIFYFRCFNKIYTARNELKPLAILIRNAIQNLDEWFLYANTETKMLLKNAIGISLFQLKEYDEAYYFFKQNIESFNKATRKEIQTFGYLFLVLITYELKNELQFESSYNNAYIHFSRHKNALPFQRILLQLFNQTFKDRKSKESKAKMADVLQQLEATSNEPTQQFFFSYFNFADWIATKL